MTAMSTLPIGGAYNPNMMMKGGKTSKNFYDEKRPHGMQPYSYQQFTPEQMQLLQSLYPHLIEGSYLSKLAGGDEEAFREMEAPAWRNFEESMGQLGSRFSGMGMGAQKGSGFNMAGTQAASDFASQLAAKRHETQRSALADLISMSHILMGERPMERGFISKKEKQPGFLENFGSSFAQKFGSLVGGGF